MQLTRISRILVSMSPWHQGKDASREFLARITSSKAKASNPNCKIETDVKIKGESYVEVTYENKSVERIVASGRTVNQILELVQNKAEEMDTAAKLKDAGLAGKQLETSWAGLAGRKEAEVGGALRIPRTQ